MEILIARNPDLKHIGISWDLHPEAGPCTLTLKLQILNFEWGGQNFMHLEGSNFRSFALRLPSKAPSKPYTPKLRSGQGARKRLSDSSSFEGPARSEA